MFGIVAVIAKMRKNVGEGYENIAVDIDDDYFDAENNKQHLSLVFVLCWIFCLIGFFV